MASFLTRFESPVQDNQDQGVTDTTPEDAAATVAKLLSVLSPGQTVTVNVQA